MEGRAIPFGKDRLPNAAWGKRNEADLLSYDRQREEDSLGDIGDENELEEARPKRSLKKRSVSRKKHIPPVEKDFREEIEIERVFQAREISHEDSLK